MVVAGVLVRKGSAPVLRLEACRVRLETCLGGPVYLHFLFGLSTVGFNTVYEVPILVDGETKIYCIVFVIHV